MKWYEAHQNPTMADVKRDFIKEFKLPQTDQQRLLEMWEIKQREGDTGRDLMRRFKDVIGKLSYTKLIQTIRGIGSSKLYYP